MNIVYILRGLPGSGKSTLAKILTASGGKICSTDNFFIKGGIYKFRPELLSEAHAWNFEEFKLAFNQFYTTIVVDNTNIKRRDFQHYVYLAQQNCFEVQEITVGTFDEKGIQISMNRNTHNVPESSIRRMAANFER